MPKPATLGSEELLGYGLRLTNYRTLGARLSIRCAEDHVISGVRTLARTTATALGFISRV
jgi:hypothetical protein